MNAFIVEAKRIPIGRSHKDNGVYKDVRADELLARLLMNFVPRLLPYEAISDVYIGCVGQHLEQGKNIARLAALLAGFPDSVPGVTINRLCASSLQAFNFGAMTLDCGQGETILAGGVEHMHHVPMSQCTDYHKDLFEKREFLFTNMGLTAEKVAEIYKISRQEQDELALLSHQRAIAAIEGGHFKKEILPVNTPAGLIETDQGPRKSSTLEILSTMKTIFKENGTVTAANSSPLSDGASLVLLASEDSCSKYCLRKKAEVLDFAVVGLDPCIMGMGPVYAIQKLLMKRNMSVNDIDFFEINEAFASQAIASIRELKIPMEKVNSNGGAIALGHPLGSSGTRLITTLLHNLEARDCELGIASMCIGHGQGIATLIRRV